MLANKVHYYLVSIKRYEEKGLIHLHSVIPALSPKRAMYLAQEEFERNGWIVSDDYENYKEIIL